VELEVTGLRNPCILIERFMPGLLSAVLEKTKSGKLIRKTGIMTIARTGGIVRPGDGIQAVLPPLPHAQLECV
jgi:MOSC domain-containing protein YiiM